MRLDSEGVVWVPGSIGIGTQTPLTKLNVVQTVDFDVTNANSTAGIHVQGGATQGQDQYGGAVTLSRVNAGRPGAGMAAVQTSTDVDQMGLALLTHASASSNDTLVEQVRITHNGNVGLGTANPEGKFHLNNGNILVRGTGSSYSIQLETYVNNGNDCTFIFKKAKGGSSSGPADVTTGNDLGTVSYQAYMDGGYHDVAEIKAEVSNDGTTTTGSIPSQLLFSTANDGSTSPTERLRLNCSGAIGIGGAKYGASGDILVSQGSIAAPVWTTFGAVKTTMTDNTSVNSSTSFTNYNVLNGTAAFNTGGYTVTTSGIEVPADGVYMVTSNIYVNNPSDQRIKVEIAFSVDDVVENEIGSTMYIRNSAGIVDSSAHLTSYLSLTSGERVNVVFRQAGLADSATTTLSGANSALMLNRVG